MYENQTQALPPVPELVFEKSLCERFFFFILTLKRVLQKVVREAGFKAVPGFP